MKSKKNTLLQKFLRGAFVGFLVTANFFIASPLVFAQGCSPGYGTLPTEVFVPWYQYLGSETDAKTGKCTPVLGDDYPKEISLIALAVLDTLLRVSGILATAYLIWGATQYITSQGDQNGIANAKNTILNAIVGLVIVLLSIGVVQFVGNLAR